MAKAGEADCQWIGSDPGGNIGFGASGERRAEGFAPEHYIAHHPRAGRFA